MPSSPSSSARIALPTPIPSTREEDAVLPLPPYVPPVSEVRSTLVSSSILALRARGDFDRYAARLPRATREEIVHVVAGVWLPYELAEQHYRACDQLGYCDADLIGIGRAVGERIHGTILSTAVKLAKTSGATPWTSFTLFGRLWSRMFVGGAIAVYTLGPQQARVEVVGNPLVAIGYFRGAQRALLLALIELYCRKAHACVERATAPPTRVAYRFQWA